MNYYDRLRVILVGIHELYITGALKEGKFGGNSDAHGSE